MRCEDIAEQLSEYVDGILEPGRTEQLESHLAGCAACRNALQTLRQTVAMLHDMEAPEPPVDLLARVHAELDAELATPRHRGRKHGTTIWSLFSRPPMQLAIAASLLAVVSIHFLQDQDPGTVAPSVDPASRQRAAHEAVSLEEASEQTDKQIALEEADSDNIQPEATVVPAEELASAMLDEVSVLDAVPADEREEPEGMVAETQRERSVPDASVRAIGQAKALKGATERNGAIWGGPVPESLPSERRSEASMAAPSASAVEPAPVVMSPAGSVADSAFSKNARRGRQIAGNLDAGRFEQKRMSRSDLLADAENAKKKDVEPRRTEITVAAVDPAAILKHVERLSLSHYEVVARAARGKSVDDYVIASDDLIGHGTDDRKGATPRVFHVEVAADKYAELMAHLQAFEETPVGQQADATSALERDKADNVEVTEEIERPVSRQPIMLIISIVSP